MTREAMGMTLLPARQVRNSLEHMVKSGAISVDKVDAWKQRLADKKMVADERRAEVDTEENTGPLWNAVQEASRTGQLVHLKAELQKPNCNANECFQGTSVLYLACLSGVQRHDGLRYDGSPMIRLLLDAGADVSIGNGDISSIWVSAKRGFADTVRLLLMAGAEDTVTSPIGNRQQKHG